MKMAPFLVAGAVLGMTTGLIASGAEAKVRVVPYSKAGNWNVRAVYSARGRFDHCSANARYQSGTRVSIIVYRSGNWRLWFAHNNWPDRGKAAFPATVRVDDQVVLSQNGRYKGRNAYIDLGREIQRVKALMRGRSMAISTPAGTSRFSLRGTNKATRLVAVVGRRIISGRRHLVVPLPVPLRIAVEHLAPAMLFGGRGEMSCRAPTRWRLRHDI